MESVEKLILQELREIKEELRALNSKIDNFAGYFEADEDEIKELMEELKGARRNGVKLEEVLHEL
ncbi:hypothetical protein [Thermococcus sp. AM4]|uniref:hypothetical protein n=1 Tax=Thermococcus sp. (strain AM4) TaxID=246969 RepID=UPI0001871128|nr:hypothetical protein [Thermococcus sp. AM4]EEB73152.1 hypothetical protein TAM4_2009 [Thermococcus sp. AM4]